MQRKLVLLYLGVILAFVLLIGRITYINAFNGEKYSKTVLDQQQYGSHTIPFKRGDILDRNGVKLATSKRAYNVVLDVKALLGNDAYMDPTIDALTACFDLEEDDIREVCATSPNSRYSVLVKGVDYESAKAFEEIDDADTNVSGVWLEEDYIRTYPYDTLASSVIGFTVNGNVGSNGLEASYNSVLNGTDGREYGYTDDASGSEMTVKEAVNGSTIVSTIDLEVQKAVEERVLAFNKAHKNGATEGEGSANTGVIVMNPQNGEILAMCDYPNYDLNNPRDLSTYYSEEELAEMSSEDKVEKLNSLWNNFCVNTSYEPGSTIKPFTLAEGFDLGTLTGEESYYCGGVLHIADHDIHCANRNGHGQQTLKKVLENSCNVGLMQIGMQIGKEEFCRYQANFGFGQYTGIDLTGESAGVVYSEEDMDLSTLATNAFGQNFDATMIQVASGFSSLVNGGYYYKPHVVKEIQDENGNVTETKDATLLRRTISEESSDLIKEYMLGVVSEGTGSTAQVAGYEVGGKTGTAEKLPRGNGKYLVSFIGYAPQENPQVVVYVVIDEPNVYSQADSKLAQSLASQIMSDIFPYLGVVKADGTVETKATASHGTSLTEEETDDQALAVSSEDTP